MGRFGLAGTLVLVAGALAGCGDAGGDGGGSGGQAAGLGGSGTGGSVPGSGGGSGTSGSGSSTGASGGGATGGGATLDTTLFSPDIPRQYVGSVVEPGMEITAFTIREDEYDSGVWLAALTNTGTDRLCAINMNVTFLDATGAEISTGMGIVEVPLHRGVSGTGGLVNCLGPGQVGMTVDTLALTAADVPNVASISYEFGAMILTDAVPTDDITVSGVQIVDEGGGRFSFSGQLNNNSSAPVSNPSVSIFGVNSVGRPLAEAQDIELTTVAAGSSWSFSTTTFNVPVADYVAFPDASD